MSVEAATCVVSALASGSVTTVARTGRMEEEEGRLAAARIALLSTVSIVPLLTTLARQRAWRGRGGASPLRFVLNFE